MSIPRVSIVVPLYKAEHFMNVCVDSILNQTLGEIEVLLVNDGSPDGSGMIADEYAIKDSRVKVIHQSNKGPGAARNRGMLEATGEYIGFVDSDDWVEPKMYESLYAEAANCDASIAMCDFIEEFPSAGIKRKKNIPLNSGEVLDKEQIKDIILTSFAVNSGIYYASMSNKLYKRKWILKNNLIVVESRDIAEDWLFNIDAFCLAERAIYVCGHFYHYMHINPSSLMYKYRSDQFTLKLESRRKLIEKLVGRGVDLLSYKQEMDTRFCLEAVACIFSEIIVKQRLSAKLKKIHHIINNTEVTSAINNSKSGSLHMNCILFLMKYRLKMPVFIVFLFWRTISSMKGMVKA